MPEKLNIHAKNITSQHGEDGILKYIVGCLGDRMEKTVCEFGAWDGKVASNVYTFWHDRRWKAILIEGDREKARELQENVKGYEVSVFGTFVAMEGPSSVDGIFRDNGIAPRVGIMSIDIDSYDYHVWKHMAYVVPQVVVIEHNQHIPPHIDYFDPEGHVYLKCSAKALERLGREKGYRLVCCTKTNSIFVRDDLFDPACFPDMPVEWLFDYSTLEPLLIFTSEDGNKYPVFSRKAKESRKRLMRLYYGLSAFFKRKRTYYRPPDEVVRQIRSAGMDV